ncbi:hypothetical protein ACFST9_04210 [Hymenobacter monticola]|uniref:Scaffolding protein n=1 Tax=Hymenobacter monticola TaxID=1705399 RepID=A0ABY4B0Z9_9BACT|nr:hypothetical protein [Hymenobacter monticola]UOE32842.1 hypothetical protein MTP16_17110 [Hymenobacter monticola]
MTDEKRKSLLSRLAVALGLSEDATEVEVALTAYKTKAGDEIEVNDEDQTTTAADGEYELEDGKILVVSEGKAEVKEAPQEEEKAAEEAPEDQKVEDDAMAQMQAAIDALTARLDALEGKNTELEKSNTELSEKLSAVESRPADKKVVLNANQGQKSKAQLAFERAQARN